MKMKKWILSALLCVSMIGIVRPTTADTGVFIVDANGAKDKKEGRGDSVRNVSCSCDYSK